MKKAVCIIAALTLMLGTLSGCDLRSKYTDYSFDYFDTVTTIVGYEKNEQTFSENCEKIKQKLSQYHKLYTIYDEVGGTVNLKNVNDEAALSSVKVESPISDLLLFGVSAYEKTGGRVNIAMGSVLSIWHKARLEKVIPSAAELEKAAKHTNIYDMIVDDSQGTVLFTDSELKIDVGAVAKGYAAKMISRWMTDEGMRDYSLSIGGNVVAMGDKTWSVGIENPFADNDENPYCEVVKVRNMSVVTSGSYQRFFTVGGKDYHHIIDPKTLMPADYFVSVTVICEDSGMADALSTALFCMDYQSGNALIEGMADAEAMWITKDGQKLYSSGFESYCK